MAGTKGVCFKPIDSVENKDIHEGGMSFRASQLIFDGRRAIEESG